MKIEMGKEYTTRNGKEVRILCTNRKGDFPIVALVLDDHDVVCAYTSGGQLLSSGISHFDLIEKPKQLEGWINIYPTQAVLHLTKDYADSGALPERIACIDLSQFKKGEGL